MTQKNKQKGKGIVPLVKINGHWHCIFQLSFSSYELDLKMDPCRGRGESTTTASASNDSGRVPDVSSTTDSTHESDIEIAIRETYEESRQVLDFYSVSHLITKRHIDGIFYVKIEFASCLDATSVDQHVQNLLSAYDANSKLVCCDETVGLIAYHNAYHNNLKVKCATQATEIFNRVSKLNMDRVPLIKLNRVEKNGIISYKANELEDGTDNVQLVGHIEHQPLYSSIVDQPNEIRKLLVEFIVNKLKKYPQDVTYVKGLLDTEPFEDIRDDKKIHQAIKNSEYANRLRSRKRVSSGEGMKRSNNTSKEGKNSDKQPSTTKSAPNKPKVTKATSSAKQPLDKNVDKPVPNNTGSKRSNK